MIASQQINNDKTNEMYEIFNSLKGGRKTAIWGIGFFMAMGSFYLMAKNIFIK